LWLEGSDEMPRMRELDGDDRTVLWQMWSKESMFLQKKGVNISKMGMLVKKLMFSTSKLYLAKTDLGILH